MGEGSREVVTGKIEGLQCSFCVETLRKALERLPGVEEVNVSLAHEEIFVRYDKSVTSRREIENLIERLGFRLAYRGRGLYEEALRAEKARLLRSLALTAIVGALMLYMKLYSPSNAIALIVGALASANLFILGRRYLSMAMSALRRGILNQHVLMSATALSGLAGGTLGLLISPETFPPGEFYGVTSFVTTYHILGGYAAGYARKRASDAIERLKSLQPSIARVIEGGGLVEKPVEDVKRGDLILVKPGERIPLDGVVVEGETSVDESIVTGESTPVDKRPGDRVVAGSINVVGAIVVRVARPSSESFIARIARHMEEMRGLKPPILQLLDRVLGVYVPLVLSVALTALSYWIIAPWLLGGSPDVSRASFAFLTVLVMGYPCALGMSVPLSMIRGGQFAALKGILFRGVEPIHILAGRGVIFFDKTGTLTEGRPSVEHVEALEGYSEEDVLRASACLEVFSNHPLARSIVDKAYESHGGIECGEVRGVKEYRGLGIEGFINGARVAVGRLEFLEDKGFTAPAGLEATVDRLHSLGLTLVFVGINGRIAGLIGVSDKVKEGASQAIEELKRLGFRVGMLTGDSERVAARIAEILGIDTYKAGLLPEEKTRIIRELQRRGERVIMVGDGINDAPSLTVADVGIALGTGADITVEAADVVITGGNPYKVVESVKISRYMYNHTKQNLGIAFSLNGIGVPVAATGLLQPYWAMIAMIASVSLILANTFLRKIG